MKFVVSGYFGFENIGDESILAAMIQHLRGISHDLEIVALSKDPHLTEELHKVPAISRTDILGISRELAGADLLISGGGGLLQDVTGPRSVPYYLGLVALAKAMRKPVFFYAQGIGPLNRRFSKSLVKAIGNLVDFITVRDEPSGILLKSLGVTRPRIDVGADPVFGLEPACRAGTGGNLLEDMGIPAQRGPLVVVSVRPWQAVPGYIQAIAAACDGLARTYGATIVHVPFHRVQDIPICQACIELMQEHAYILDARLSPGEVLSVMEEADFVIGMRYHSLVYAVATATPFVALSYDPKVDGLLTVVGEKPGLSRDRPDVDSFPHYVRDVWGRREQMRANLAIVAPKLAESAKHVAHLAIETAKQYSTGQLR